MNNLSRWPDKQTREEIEINYVVNHLSKLFPACSFEIVEHREKPDYIIQDKNHNICIGVELTSVYLSDRSVPEHHKADNFPIIEIPFNQEQINVVLNRIIVAVNGKRQKAIDWSHNCDCLILAILQNEYCMIHFEPMDWRKWISSQSDFFHDISPFAYVLLYEGENGFSCLAPPSNKNPCRAG